MSYYSYYQQQPQWGTTGHQVVAPPRPYFQPQSNWGGRQYFQAQVGGLYNDYDELRDEGFFDSVWRGLKDVFSRGFAREDAALWHRRVYGGQVPIDELDPTQIGAAAGYEAIRHWQTYGSTYRSPLSDDRGREKEALAGLAAGEAIKLLSYSHRRRSGNTRREAAEIAAATAERIYADDFDDPYAPFESSQYGGRRRRGSFLRRRSSSFYDDQRPAVSAATGVGYVSAQPTGASYVSAGTPGVQYVSAGATGYAAAQPTYMTSTGQPVQYMQSPGVYSQQPTGMYGQQPTAMYGQPTGVYGQPTGVYGQPTIISGGQQVQFPGTPGVTYATPGTPYAQPTYMTGGTQYVQSTGYSQPGYAVTGTPSGYAGAPQGYTRARALSTGYAQAPQVLYR